MNKHILLVVIILIITILACGGDATTSRSSNITAPEAPTFTHTPIPPPPTNAPSPPATDTPLPAPTETPSPTNTPVPPPATNTSAPLPTNTPLPAPTDTPPTPPPPAEAVVKIVALDKKLEYAEIQNIGGAPQDLTGWMLRSEKGNQDCPLGGVIQPGEILRIWARAEDVGQGGYNCQFDGNIWNNSESDPAVLFNSAGQEVDRR